MPTLELFNADALPDGWHDVRAPGGYEWWYFDAEDAASDTQVVGILMQGFIFHPGYLRDYDRYVRRPTRTLPPVPGNYPCAYLCVYRGGRIWQQFFTQYRPDDFHAAADEVSVDLGPNRLRMDADGSYHLKLCGSPWALGGRGPQTFVDRTLEADLRFTPTSRHAPLERTFLSRAMTGATHEWVIAAPHCSVSGTIRLAPVAGDAETRPRFVDGEPAVPDVALPFAGRGYHDHNYGTAPIGRGIDRWTWGRAMFNDRVVTFHHAEPTDRTGVAETHLVEVTAGGVREHEVSTVTADWSLTCRPALMLRYPAMLDFGPILQLSNPRVIDPAPFYLRLMFDAESLGERSTAFCEVAYPHRLRWPILGRMIEMSFDKRPIRRPLEAPAPAPTPG